jgi:hypothetical protein
LLEELTIHLKICGSQTNFQQFRDGFDLQDSPLCRVSWSLFLITCKASLTGTLVKTLTASKLTEYLEIESLQTSTTVRSCPNSLRRIPIYRQ